MPLGRWASTRRGCVRSFFLRAMVTPAGAGDHPTRRARRGGVGCACCGIGGRTAGRGRCVVDLRPLVNERSNKHRAGHPCRGRRPRTLSDSPPRPPPDPRSAPPYSPCAQIGANAAGLPTAPPAPCRTPQFVPIAPSPSRRPTSPRPRVRTGCATATASSSTRRRTPRATAAAARSGSAGRGPAASRRSSRAATPACPSIARRSSTCPSRSSPTCAATCATSSSASTRAAGCGSSATSARARRRSP